MNTALLILVDNAVSDDALRAEHGLSILVTGPDRTVLFDAAASSDALLANARTLGVELSDVDTVVVSHGHYDHTGGLAEILQRCKGVTVCAHAGAFHKRWSNHPGKPLKDVSCPCSIEQICRCGAALHSVSHPERIEPWLIVSGPVGGSRHGAEHFVVRRAGEMVVDGFEDEIFLLVRGREGWTVITGCCHRGLKNTLRTARFLVRGERLIRLVGGLHLRDARYPELLAAVELLREFDLTHIHPCHCTGEAAVGFLREHLPDQVHVARAGTRLEL